MRALIQRVSSARCTVAGEVTGEIQTGLAVLIGACHEDEPADADWLARKIAGLRIFPDASGQMNLDLQAVRGRALVVPQFTLYGDARRGRRPDFMRAARPEHAEPLVDRFCASLAATGIEVERGVFRAHMEIALVNDGPVTLMIETRSSGGGERADARRGEAAP